MNYAEARERRAAIHALSNSERAQARGMTENDLQAAIEELCGQLRLTWCHPLSLKGIPKGWPDLVIVSWHGVLWRELKTHTGRLSPEQRAFGEQLRQGGQNWDVWRPLDYLTGQIERELTRIAAVQYQLWTG
jgi:VRR-NUC domain